MSPGRSLAGLAATGALALSASACGAGGGAARTAHADAVIWQGTPQVFQPRGLPRDRVLIGRIRNPGRSMLELKASQVLVRDATGKRVPGASAAFVAGYAHGLFGALQQPAAIPRTEAARLGRLVYLFGGASAPFFAAWHLPAGSREPMSVEIGHFRLAVPRGAPQLTAR